MHQQFLQGGKYFKASLCKRRTVQYTVGIVLLLDMIWSVMCVCGMVPAALSGGIKQLMSTVTQQKSRYTQAIATVPFKEFRYLMYHQIESFKQKPSSKSWAGTN